MTDPYPDSEWQSESLSHASPVEVRAPGQGAFATSSAAVLVAVLVGGLGLAVGWIWSSVAPRVAVIKTDTGFVYADPEPEQAVAADGWFAIIGAIVGVVLAVLIWVLLRRHRGVVVMLGLGLGSLVGASLAWWVGYKIGFSQFEEVRDTAPVGTRLDGPLRLRMTGLDRSAWWPPRPTGVAAVQALAAVFAYTALAGFSSYASLRGPDRFPTIWNPPGTVDTPTAARSTTELDMTAPGMSEPGMSEPGMSEPGMSEPGPNQAGNPAPQPGDQLGPGLTGRSDSATGNART